MENDLDFEKDIEIDPESLDIEWLRQPSLFLRYSQQQTIADRKTARKHEKLKTLRAELILHFNKKGLPNVDRMSDAKVDAAVRNSPKYKEAKKEYLEAVYEADMIRVAVSSFHQKRSALENLVKLISLEYNAKPREPRELGGEVKKWKSSRTKRIREEQVKVASRRTKRKGG